MYRGLWRPVWILAQLHGQQLHVGISLLVLGVQNFKSFCSAWWGCCGLKSIALSHVIRHGLCFDSDWLVGKWRHLTSRRLCQCLEIWESYSGLLDIGGHHGRPLSESIGIHDIHGLRVGHVFGNMYRYSLRHGCHHWIRIGSNWGIFHLSVLLTSGTVHRRLLLVDEAWLHRCRVRRWWWGGEPFRTLAAHWATDLWTLFGTGYHRTVATSGTRNDGHWRRRNGSWAAGYGSLLFLECLNSLSDINKRRLLMLLLCLGSCWNTVLLLRSWWAVLWGLGRVQVLLDIFWGKRTVIRYRSRRGGTWLWTKDSGELGSIAENGQVTLLCQLRWCYVAGGENAEQRREERKISVVTAWNIGGTCVWSWCGREGSLVGYSVSGWSLGHVDRALSVISCSRGTACGFLGEGYRCLNGSCKYKSTYI